MRIIDAGFAGRGARLSLLSMQGVQGLERGGLGDRVAPGGGRRESVLGGLSAASLLRTPPPGATRPPFSGVGAGAGAGVLGLLSVQGEQGFERGGLGDRVAPGGGRRESVLGGLSAASLLRTPPPGATRPPFSGGGDGSGMGGVVLAGDAGIRLDRRSTLMSALGGDFALVAVTVAVVAVVAAIAVPEMVVPEMVVAAADRSLATVEAAL